MIKDRSNGAISLGNWNPSTNVPELASTPQPLFYGLGYYFTATAAGSRFGFDFAVGDRIVATPGDDGNYAWNKQDALPAFLSFSTILVPDEDPIEAGAENDSFSLIAGSNITITTDPETNEITISATGGGGGGTPGGVENSIQTNDGAGDFYGDANFLYDGTKAAILGGRSLRAEYGSNYIEIHHNGAEGFLTSNTGFRLQGSYVVIDEDLIVGTITSGGALNLNPVGDINLQQDVHGQIFYLSSIRGASSGNEEIKINGGNKVEFVRGFLSSNDSEINGDLTLLNGGNFIFNSPDGTQSSAIALTDFNELKITNASGGSVQFDGLPTYWKNNGNYAFASVASDGSGLTIGSSGGITSFTGAVGAFYSFDAPIQTFSGDEFTSISQDGSTGLLRSSTNLSITSANYTVFFSGADAVAQIDGDGIQLPESKMLKFFNFDSNLFSGILNSGGVGENILSHEGADSYEFDNKTKIDGAVITKFDSDSSAGSTLSIDPTVIGTGKRYNLTTDCAITFDTSNLPASNYKTSIEFELYQDATGNRKVTFTNAFVDNCFFSTTLDMDNRGDFPTRILVDFYPTGTPGIFRIGVSNKDQITKPFYGVTTTNATPTTIATIAVANGKTVTYEGSLVMRRTGGSSIIGDVGDSAAGPFSISVQSVYDGVSDYDLTIVNSDENVVGLGSLVAAALTFSISGTDLLIQVTGAVDVNATSQLIAQQKFEV